MADLNFKLLKWQKEVLNDKHRFKVIVAGRRCGKSRYAAISLLIKALSCPIGANVMYVAPTQGQARVIIWDTLLRLGRDVIESSHINNMEIKLVNGVIIYVRGADNPETLRGMALWYVVLDEYADMKPIVWEQIISAALTDYKGDALFIGTPKGKDNNFYDLYMLGLSGDEEWKSWHFISLDNELIDTKEIEAARKRMSTFAFMQEHMASFDNAGTDLFKEAWLKYGDEPVDGTYLVSVDLAGFEAVSNAKGSKKKLDQTAISIVKVTDDGKWFVKKIIYGRWDIRENAIRILKAIRDYRPSQVGIEKGALYNAVMPYLSDLMRKNGVFAHIKPLTHGNQKKNDRVMWALQGRFEHGRIILNKDEEWSEFVYQYLMFPTSGVHDDCFPAETPIITKNGVKQISEITTDDYVLTRNGYRKVIKAWCKGNKEVITRFGITATPDHRIFTENKGWVSLDSLSINDILVVSQTIDTTSCERQSNLTVENTTDTQKQSSQVIGGTTLHMTSGNHLQDYCIETYGSSITGKSLMDTISTTQTVTSTTMIYQTLFASHLPHIKWSIERKEASELEVSSKKNILDESGILQENGTSQKQENNGIENTQNAQSEKIYKKNNVLSVEKCLSQKYKNLQCAAKNAEEHEAIDCKTQNIVPVYDLMVEHDHEFFAYGVLVHNCIDSLSLVDQMAISNYGSGDDDGDGFEPIEIITGY